MDGLTPPPPAPTGQVVLDLSTIVQRIEVTPKIGMVDVRGEVVRRSLLNNHQITVGKVRSIVGFLVNSNLSESELIEDLDVLFADPIIENATCNSPLLEDKNQFSERPDAVISIGFKPGVTDNPGSAALDGLRTLHPELTDAAGISTTMTYSFFDLDEETLFISSIKTPFFFSFCRICLILSLVTSNCLPTSSKV